MEYEVPEAAQLALEQMNSVMLGGRNIKVRAREAGPGLMGDMLCPVTQEMQSPSRGLKWTMADGRLLVPCLSPRWAGPAT